MTIKYYYDLEQNSKEWYDIRCGVITASGVSNIITPVKLEPSKGTAYFNELLAQRVYGYVPKTYESYDMKMGNMFEDVARDLYSEHYSPVKKCGFVTNTKHGFTLGYSPDGLLGDDGLIEIKRKIEKLQIQILSANEMPTEHRLQVQTGLLVTERDYCDFISYKDGMHMLVKEVTTDKEVQDKIIEGAYIFDKRLKEAKEQFNNMMASKDIRVIKTERVLTEQDIVGELK